MNKTIKLSLAAAMVAGMVSNANAKVSLEEAIKDVTVKGYISYTMEEYLDKDGSDNEAQHDIDVRIQTDLKINDNYSATIRVDEANDDDTDATTFTGITVSEDNNNSTSDTTASLVSDKKVKDSSPLEPEIDQAYITYKDGGLKIKAGLQKVIAPRLHDSLNGDGFIVSNKLSDAMTIAGGYFFTNEGTTTDDVAGLALSGKAGDIKYSATYATIIDSDEANGNDGTAADNGAKAIDLTVDAKMGDLSINGAYTTKSLDDGTKDQKLMKLVASGKAGDVNYAVAYATAGKDGAQVSLDADSDASVNLVLDSVSTNDIADGSAIYAMVGTKLSDKLSASLQYVTADGEGTVKSASEYMLTLTNKVNKKFKTFIKYNGWEVEKATTAENTKVTFGAKYSF